MIAVVGPGAVGGLLAALLDRLEHDITVVARPVTAARLKRDGLSVTSKRFGSFTTQPPVATRVPEGADVILAVKTHGLPDVLPLLGTAGPVEVLSLLNGIDHVATLRATEGIQLVAGAALNVEALRTEQAIEHRSDFLSVVVPEEAQHWRTVAALQEAEVDITVGGGEPEVLWGKLRMLAPLALLTAYWDMPLGDALSHDGQLTDGLVLEVADLVSDAGLPTDSTHLYQTLQRIEPSMRSSLQHDIAAGRPSELEAIGGMLLDRAESAGKDTPALSRIVAELRIRQESAFHRAADPKTAAEFSEPRDGSPSPEQ